MTKNIKNIFVISSLYQFYLYQFFFLVFASQITYVVEMCNTKKAPLYPTNKDDGKILTHQLEKKPLSFREIGDLNEFNEELQYFERLSIVCDFSKISEQMYQRCYLCQYLHNNDTITFIETSINLKKDNLKNLCCHNKNVYIFCDTLLRASYGT